MTVTPDAHLDLVLWYHQYHGSGRLSRTGRLWLAWAGSGGNRETPRGEGTYRVTCSSAAGSCLTACSCSCAQRTPGVDLDVSSALPTHSSLEPHAPERRQGLDARQG